MGEYEPDDSRDVTLSQNRAPGEPPRTGPREAESRQQEGKASPAAGRREAEQREAAIERDTQELNEADAARRESGG